MRIVHAIQGVDPRFGGPTHKLRCLVREQVKCGHEVRILSTEVQGFGPQRPREQYLCEMRSDPSLAGAALCLGRVWSGRPPLSQIGYSPDCSRELRRMPRPDVIHIHGVFGHVAAASSAWGRRQGIPYLITPCGNLDRTCVASARKWLKNLYLRLVYRNLRNATVFHAASEFEAGELNRLVSPERIRVVPLGADVPQFDPDDARRYFLELFPCLQGRQIILFLSRITAIKRPELLCHAVAKLLPERPNLTLLMVGNEDAHARALRSTIAHLGIERSVVFAGYLEGKAKQAAFAAADLFALPSAHENFGIAAVEAMAHGVPVLITPAVACHKHVDRCGGGLTVEASAESFANGIRKLMNEPRDMVGHRARQYVREHLSWSAFAAGLERVYCEMLIEKDAAASKRRLRGAA
ncbi:MAG: glycosyltransferase [Bryobacterales bacterium]|nr:glycosyltransferase [Bryobacterales bacterium]